MNRRMIAGVLATVGLTVGALSGTASAHGGQPATIIQPVGAVRSLYRLGSAEFWRTAHGTPVHTGSVVTHPFVATGAIDCGVGQSGPVWYLGGIFGAPSNTTVERSCDVPEHTVMFLALYNWFYDNSNCDGFPPTTLTTAELRAGAKAGVDQATSVTAVIDGATVNGLSASSQYRLTSPVFSYTTPVDSLNNVFFCSFAPQTVTGAVADGIYLALQPMTKGNHDVHWNVQSADGLIIDVTYHFHVIDD